MGRKICKKCNGEQNIHLDNCGRWGKIFCMDLGPLQGCTCGFPVCPECEGTGERNRKK